MAYVQFQLKKALKNNIFLITVPLLLIISLVILGLNAATSKNMSLENQAKGNLAMRNNAINQMKYSLKHYKKNGEAYNLTKQSISDTKNSAKIVRIYSMHSSNKIGKKFITIS